MLLSLHINTLRWGANNLRADVSIPDSSQTNSHTVCDLELYRDVLKISSYPCIQHNLNYHISRYETYLMPNNNNYDTDSNSNSTSYFPLFQMNAFQHIEFEVRISNCDFRYRYLLTLLRPLQTSDISFYIFWTLLLYIIAPEI